MNQRNITERDYIVMHFVGLAAEAQWTQLSKYSYTEREEENGKNAYPGRDVHICTTQFQHYTVKQNTSLKLRDRESKQI